MRLRVIPKDRVHALVVPPEPGGTASCDGSPPEVDLFVRAVLLENDSSEPAEWDRLRIELVTPPEEIAARADLLATGLEHGCAATQRQLDPKLARFFPMVLGPGFDLPLADLVGSRRLEPGTWTGILYQHHRLRTEAPIRALCVRARVTGSRGIEELVHTVEVRPSSSEKKWWFPVRGDWLVLGAFDDSVFGAHRRLCAHEFALDLVRIGATNELAVGDRNEDHLCHHEPVYAVGAGEVVTCCDALPENPAPGRMLPEETKRPLVERHGSDLEVLGNHVIVRHFESELSLYAHLAYESLVVTCGDRVERGQMLARVGNSGPSSGPHLHFCLLDGPDPVTSRGIPCRFEGLKDPVLGVESPLPRSFRLVRSEQPTLPHHRRMGAAQDRKEEKTQRPGSS